MNENSRNKGQEGWGRLFTVGITTGLYPRRGGGTLFWIWSCQKVQWRDIFLPFCPELFSNYRTMKF